MIKFGPSGSSTEFLSDKKRTSLDMPKWIEALELDCFEYSFGQGVRISNEKASEIGQRFMEKGIEISVHAPYFISFASLEEEKILKSTNYILQSLEKLSKFGGERCIFHPGSEGGQTREVAMKKILSALEYTVEQKNLNGYNDMIICPETMGKQAQIGTVEEIIEMCKLDLKIYPCIDFGHINAREGGILKSEDDYMRIVEKLFNGIGDEKTKNMHIHFSKIQYGPKGELRHLTFEDDTYGPNFEPLGNVIYKLGLTPHILSESAGTQDRDAQFMKKYYQSLFD